MHIYIAAQCNNGVYNPSPTTHNARHFPGTYLHKQDSSERRPIVLNSPVLVNMALQNALKAWQ